MDLSTKQVQEIQEIEKQINPDATTGPKVISQKVEKDRSVLINLLAALGISAAGTAAVILLLVLPVGKRPQTTQPTITTGTMQIQPNITVQTVYVNPFETKAQYDNPFIASQNPFTGLKQ